MERAGSVLGKLSSAKRVLTVEERAIAAWRGAVGRKTAEHARAERMVRTRLVIGCDDAVWRSQLNAMSRMILSQLAVILGPGVVEDLEFRIAPQRRGPVRATAAAAADEADSIRDPGLRRLYLKSRKKETA